MLETETKRLKWRRQFLLARAPISELGDWYVAQVGSYYLHAHRDLEAAAFSERGRHLVVLGYLFDPVHHRKSNQEILEHIAGSTRRFQEVIVALKPYAGRYVLLSLDSGGLRVVQDALSLREVYYCTRPNLVVCASQPRLIAEYAQPRLEPCRDAEVVRFYQRDAKRVRNGRLWVGDGCYLSGVRHLLPNRFLDVEEHRVQRYWPNEKWRTLELDETVERACHFLQGMMRAVTHRHSVMVAVTAGTDSRTLLAASRDVSNRVYYFVNKRGRLTWRSADISIPMKIFDRIGVPFRVHEVVNEVDPEFRKIFLGNTFFASARLLPTIYNVYYREHADKVNVLGVGEIGRALWGTTPRKVTPHYLAHSLGYSRSNYATRECERWLSEVRPLSEAYGVDLMTLLLWEQLLGNWGAVGNSESDIAIEEFDPYDSHYMYETLLAVDERSIGGDRHLVFREMIRTMWPELLEYPINPPDTAVAKARSVLIRLGVYPLVKNARYQWNRFRFSRLASTESEPERDAPTTEL